MGLARQRNSGLEMEKGQCNEATKQVVEYFMIAYHFV